MSSPFLEIDLPIDSRLYLPCVSVPEGWDLLPAGPTRSVRVVKSEIGKPDGLPFVVLEDHACRRLYAEVKILGESRMVHQLAPPSGETGLACLETESAMLGKRCPDHRPNC